MNADTNPYVGYTAAGSAFTRATDPDYFGWIEHIRAACGRTRPIRLAGQLLTVEPATGRLLDARHRLHAGCRYLQGRAATASPPSAPPAPRPTNATPTNC